MEAAIKVSSLSKSFGRKIVLDNLDFTIPNNAIAGFLGPNGAGKTTTLRILLGLIPLQKGEIKMLDWPVPSQRVKALEEIGAVVENPNFIETMTAYENLYWFGSLYKPVKKERIKEVIGQVGLKDSIDQRFGSFSTGMKQRLGVAFGILHKPKLLILDEPTSGMDPMGRVQMREILKSIHASEGTTIFLSSHLLDEVQRLCDYVVIIDKGQTKKEGYVEALLDKRQEVWEVRLPDEQVEKAREVLKELSEKIIDIDDTPQGLLLTLNPETSSFVNRKLVEEKITVKALIPREASLEDTFIKLTDRNEGGAD